MHNGRSSDTFARSVDGAMSDQSPPVALQLGSVRLLAPPSGLPLETFAALDPANWELADFDLPHRLIVPLLRAFRQINTVADAVFYDVALLWLRLYTRGITLTTTSRTPGSAAQDRLAALQAVAKFINLGAVANPEGAILVIDAHHAPFVRKYDDVKEFLSGGLKFLADGEGSSPPRDIRIITVTGVGSSALGSAAVAWNVSESLREPVAAIVPGYGLADLIPQALGGWFGFGVHDFMRRFFQQALAATAPELATIGHRLVTTTPCPAATVAEASFRSGSPESDILHEILKATPQIKRLYGHSKGALCIANAIRELPNERYRDLHVTTFGCVIQEETDADYHQVLGSIDGLGQLNSWGNWPEQWITSWHSTNSMLPLTMPVSHQVKKDVRHEDPVTVDPQQLQAALKVALKELLPPRMLGGSDDDTLLLRTKGPERFAPSTPTSA